MIINYIGSPLDYSRDGMFDRSLITSISGEYDIIATSNSKNIDNNILTDSEARLLSKVISRDISYNTVIHHGNINIEKGKINIGIIEANSILLDDSIISSISGLDAIITTSEFSKKVIIDSGVINDIHVVRPHIDVYDIGAIELPDNTKDIRLLMIPEFIDRANWVEAIYQYINNFTNDDNITLIINTNNSIVKKCIDNLLIDRINVPSIVIIDGYLNTQYLASLYKSCNYFYNPYHSSNIDLFMLSSILHGTPAITTNYTNPSSYISNANSIILPHMMYPITKDEVHTWAQPKYDTIRNVLDDNNLSMETNIEGNSILEILDSINSRNARYKSDDIRVSIVVLSYNNLPMIEKCIEALVCNTEYEKNSYEVIILDNGSDPDDTELFDYLKDIWNNNAGDYSNYRVIFMPTNLGFSGGNNFASSYASGDILLFLNNDTEVLSGWLDPIIEDFDNDCEVGIVGSKLLYPNHTIQHAGLAFTNNNKYYSCHPYNGEEDTFPMANIRKELHAVTGACLAIRKEIYNKLGGFDISYIRGYYEDADMCCKVRDLGYKVIYEPDSVVIHKHGQSFKKLGDISKQDFFIHNEAQFKSRWAKKVSSSIILFNSKHEYNPDVKDIAIYNSYMHTLGGGEKVVVEIAHALEDDNNVDIISNNNVLVTKEDINRKLGIKLNNTELVNLIFGELVSDHKSYDIFINCQWGSNIIGAGKYNIYSTMFPNKLDDIDWLNSYDLILSISNYTSKYIKKYWGLDSTVIYPPVTMMGIVGEVDYLHSIKNGDILSVGRFFEGQHCKKHKVMIEAFKSLVDKYKYMGVLHLVGGLDNIHSRYYMECVEQAKGYNIEFHININFDALRELYRSSSIYWHAAGYGETEPINFEHFGIAPVEAMSAGCYPILYNGGGLKEIAVTDYHWNTIDELVDHTSVIAYDKLNKDAINSLISEANKYSDAEYISNITKLIGDI